MTEHKDGEIWERVIPETVRRAKWCGPCGQWMWETGTYGSDRWRHGGARVGRYGVRPCKNKEAK